MPWARPLVVSILVGAVASAACRDGGDIRIASLEFEGVEHIDEGALRNALQTKAGSWLPFSRDYYFDRRAFDADLQRIVAYYRDRGFPDARVLRVDPRLNEAQDEIDITVEIREGLVKRGATQIRFETTQEGRREIFEVSTGG